MPEREEMPAMRDIAEALHALCQPLMALQCRLEIGQLLGTETAFREAVLESLPECERLMDRVATMRDAVRRGLEG